MVKGRSIFSRDLKNKNKRKKRENGEKEEKHLKLKNSRAWC
jgi:hypothetical protein